MLANAPDPAVDLPRLLASVRGRRQLAQNVAQAFLTELPTSLAAVNASLARRDLPEAHLVAHRLKGGLKILRAPAAADLAAALEAAARTGDADEARRLAGRLVEEIDRVVAEVASFLAA